MGYTHYWDTKEGHCNQISEESRQQLIPIVKDIVERYEDILTGDGTGKTVKPVVVPDDENRIWFNGIGDAAHETFVFSLNETPRFEFCKTRHTPYDAPVTEILIVCAHFIPNVGISSDGFSDDYGKCYINEEWLEAAQRVQELYGITTKLFHWDGNPAPAEDEAVKEGL